jgi:hypothetical protein
MRINLEAAGRGVGMISVETPAMIGVSYVLVQITPPVNEFGAPILLKLLLDGTESRMIFGHLHKDGMAATIYNPPDYTCPPPPNRFGDFFIGRFPYSP